MTNPPAVASSNQSQPTRPSERKVAVDAYQAIVNPLTPELKFVVSSQVHQSTYPMHCIPMVLGIGRLQPLAPMRPTDIRKD
jgi:hypothetical protein